jgi:hypothetical protein
MITPTSKGNQTTKVKRPREGKVCVSFIFLWVLLCGKFLFSLYVSKNPKKKNYHQESNYYLQIKHNKRFLPQSEPFCHGLGFLYFCHSFKEIAKEKEKIKINEFVVGVNM